MNANAEKRKMSRGLAIVADLKAVCASDIFAMMWLVVCTQTVLQLLPSM